MISPASPLPLQVCDICVVGGGSGGSGGIGAAVCAAEAGADVIIVEAQEMLGSTSTMAGVNA